MTITPFQLEGLRLLGYTRRESEFLFLVATYSGYFTNRQFKSFAQTESGSVSHAFIRKLLQQKHATYHAYRSGGRVYHLFARKTYQAIERENLRTRKQHELEYVKTRLVALDFILQHLKNHYLETDAEKVAFFTDQYNVGAESLPVKQYRAKGSSEITFRYFADRFPMFVSSLTNSPVPTFTYIDSGAVTLDGFRTHLRAYRALLLLLPRFEFIYIAPHTRLFQAAESEFHHLVYGRHGKSKVVSLVEYFRVRKAWDVKERVASADVILLKEAQLHYVGATVEKLYEKWREGIARDDDVIRDSIQLSDPRKSTFRTFVCGSSLKVFNDPLESDVETEIAQTGREIPAESSSEVPGS